MTEPKLAPPGAGLPVLERLLIKFFIMPRTRKSLDPNKHYHSFLKTTAALKKLSDNLDASQLSKRVLVDRIPGLEDSSRYWSAAMTLEHVAMVSSQMSALIEMLASGTSPQADISVATFKPKAERDPIGARTDFEITIEKVKADIEKIIDPKNSSTYSKFYDRSVTQSHPWFGPMTAAQWLWVLGAHQNIHRQQMKKIVAGL